MKVFIRHAEEDVGHLLCRCKFYEIEDVAAELRKYGVYYRGGTYRDFSQQFCIDETSAYAEIVLTGDSE